MKALIITGIMTAMSLSSLSAQGIDTLRGTLNSPRSLNANTCYVLDGCYRILSGGSLTLPAGTTVRGLSQSSIIVEQGGQMFAAGSSTNPVIFTYAQVDINGDPVRWDGVYFLGNAITNQSSPTINKSCAGTLSYGGSNDADNSGTLQYVRMEYGGEPSATDPEAATLNLYAIGTGTTIDHVQVSYSKKDALGIRGGKVALSNLVSLNNFKTDLAISEGYTGNIQFLTSIRLDPAAHDATGSFSNGIEVYNDGLGSSATPFTRPVMSNMTFIGPKYCGASPVSTDFRAAVRLGLNAQAEIYNSVFTGWNTGFAIFDNATIINANVNGTITAAENTFYANTVNYANSPANFDPTGTGCASTITDWMDGSVFCSQVNNIAPLTLTGYSNSLCGDYCTTPPTLTLAAMNDVGTTDYSWDSGSDFTHVTYRGSMTATDWASGWFNACPKDEVYCSLSPMKSAPAMQMLHFIPNPSSGQTAVCFTTAALGACQVSVMDKVSGKVIRSVKSHITNTGDQRVIIDVSGLNEGVYFVRVELSDRSIISGQLSVK